MTCGVMFLPARSIKRKKQKGRSAMLLPSCLSCQSVGDHPAGHSPIRLPLLFAVIFIFMPPPPPIMFIVMS